MKQDGLRTVFCYYLAMKEINLPPIKVVIFDYRGVISAGGGNFDDFLDMMSLSKVKNDSKARSEMDKLLKELAIGRISEEEFWKLFKQETGIATPKNAYKIWVDFVHQVMEPHEGMISFVRKLQEAGYITALLSNVYPLTATVLRKTGVYNMFNPVGLSCEMGVAKPNKKAFTIILNEIDCLENECLFVDDAQKNIDMANSLGIQTFLVNDIQQSINELSRTLMS